jgi:type II secretory pathway component GspD/PulD (secretin)
MRITYALAATLFMVALAPAARAQGQVYITPSAVYVSTPRALPGITAIRLQTTVAVPDGGTVSLGGFSSASEGRREAGAPIVGKLPYVDRGLRNVGSGREVVSGRVVATVRVINLRDEEYRQTGYRSP